MMRKQRSAIAAVLRLSRGEVAALLGGNFKKPCSQRQAVARSCVNTATDCPGFGAWFLENECSTLRGTAGFAHRGAFAAQ